MLSITCRCILYALVSVVVPWGVALGWVRMRLGGEKAQYTHYKKLDYTTAQFACRYQETGTVYVTS